MKGVIAQASQKWWALRRGWMERRASQKCTRGGCSKQKGQQGRRGVVDGGVRGAKVTSRDISGYRSPKRSESKSLG